MQYYIETEPGVKLFVEDIGSGTPVVLVHGWPLNHQMFEYQVTHLPKYGYRCISIDLRGYGQSDNPWEGYTYDRMADDIRVVLDTLRLTGVRLIGFSMGGAVVLHYAARHRGCRLSQLLLLSAAAPKFARGVDYPYGMPVSAIDQLLAGVYTDRPQTVASFGENFFAKPVSPAFRQWFQSLNLSPSNHGTAGGVLMLRNEDLRPDLPLIQVPTVIFHGVLDQICPYDLARLMHQGIRGSQLLTFEHSGHAIFYDELELFNQRLLQVLGGR
ncbi:alpha/beta fold hydrolase [Paenibacillus rhizophilus]|uniref:Alpha/beta hydrolase n=1 Tax=Paenibacillus rhizophilus TaxID=1850366 RepID=A0A3N9P423_9BACL|nr:alpha/beta hydrolase [Paenibacillus rhizophilus]RQW10903.1 alpha/beta hydrolase [Paenibacillus rhizophilus]